MRITLFSVRGFERPFLESANERHGHDLRPLAVPLAPATAELARGSRAVSIFVSDDASAPVLRTLHEGGTRVLLLRSAGFNHVDLDEAARLGLTVLRVPAYSPHAVAEHAVGLMLVLNRKFHRAFNRVREQNFSLDGLMGFDMHGKCAGIVGAGRIGLCVARILQGFGCRVLAFDPAPSEECRRSGVELVDFPSLLARSHILSLHCPLTPETHHLIDEAALAAMMPGVMLINTSRGGVIDTRALIGALKAGRVGSVGLDVYEEEGDLFFRDLSDAVIRDDLFVRLMTFPNVLITAHQGFLTREAVTAIEETTLRNAGDFERGVPDEANRVDASLVVPTGAAAGVDSRRR